MIDRFPEPGWGQPWWHDVLGWLVPVLILLGLAALVLWAVLRLTERRLPTAMSPPWSPVSHRPGDPAQEHARLRYAKGEMSREEFLQISADLFEGATGTRSAPAPGDTPAPGDEPAGREET